LEEEQEDQYGEKESKVVVGAGHEPITVTAEEGAGEQRVVAMGDVIDGVGRG